MACIAASRASRSVPVSGRFTSSAETVLMERPLPGFLNVRGVWPSDIAMPTDTVASTACSCVPQGQRSSCKTSPAMHSMASRLGTSFIKTMNSSSWVRATRSVARKTAGSTCVVCAMTASPASRPNMLLMLSSVSWSTRSSAWERSGRNGPEDRPPDARWFRRSRGLLWKGWEPTP